MERGEKTEGEGYTGNCPGGKKIPPLFKLIQRDNALSFESKGDRRGGGKKKKGRIKGKKTPLRPGKEKSLRKEI